MRKGLTMKHYYIQILVLLCTSNATWSMEEKSSGMWGWYSGLKNYLSGFESSQEEIKTEEQKLFEEKGVVAPSVLQKGADIGELTYINHWINSKQQQPLDERLQRASDRGLKDLLETIASIRNQLNLYKQEGSETGIAYIPEWLEPSYAYKNFEERILKELSERRRLDLLTTYLSNLEKNKETLEKTINFISVDALEKTLAGIDLLRSRYNDPALYQDLEFRMLELLAPTPENEKKLELLQQRPVIIARMTEPVVPVQQPPKKLTTRLLGEPFKPSLQLLSSQILDNKTIVKSYKTVEPGVTLIHLNAINQFLPQIVEKYSFGTCPVQAVRNAAILLGVIFGRSSLQLLTDLQNSLEVIKKSVEECGIFEWAETEEVQNIIDKQIVNLRAQDITVLENVNLLYDKAMRDIVLEVFPQRKKIFEKFAQLQKEFQQKPEFYHAFILGTTLGRTADMHWFAVLVLKKNNQIQVLIADTSPERPHLDEDVNQERIVKLLNYLQGK